MVGLTQDKSPLTEEVSMVTIESCISSAMLSLADAAECVQPFSTEARQLDKIARMLEKIDCQSESVVAK